MDHRRDASTAPRRDRLREEERQHAFNQSPWSIGAAYYDQRDLYTQNASMSDDGYGVGPDVHPEEGSYAYRRDSGDTPGVVAESDATVHEREAWPWLNYKSLHDDPYFEHLHAPEDRSPWQRFVERVRGVLGNAPGPDGPEDARIRREVQLALTYRPDLDARDIEVSVGGGTVVLDGSVVDRRSKRVAAETAESVPGVNTVRNRLAVRPDEPRDGDLAILGPLALMWG